MRVLVGKTFGIGNSVLSIPMVKAICSLSEETHVLVGRYPDDFGAVNVFQELINSSLRPPGLHLRIDPPAHDERFDVAVMSIPFDGRWQNGLDYIADRVLDERKRPGNVDRLGFDMWKKHEAEYQMDNARELGYTGSTPDCQFMDRDRYDIDLVYVGLGYKRDSGGFGLSKHFGNGRYLSLLQEIRRLRPHTRFVSTGNTSDLMQSWYQIIREWGPGYSEFYRFPMLDLHHSFKQLSSCVAYIGNDTGMLHVAASFGLPTYGLFAYHDLMVKNPPLCKRSRAVCFNSEQPDVGALAKDFVDFVWGD